MPPLTVKQLPVDMEQTVPTNWSKFEVDLAVADYMAMLSSELQGIAFNKKAHRTALLPLLNLRSHGSVEHKHQNISAVLIDIGLPYISGYKPLGNYQALLHERVAAFLGDNPSLIEVVRDFVDRPIESVAVSDYLRRLVPPPLARDRHYPIARETRPMHHRPIQINYIEREARNTSLGKAGELFVVEFEKARLIHFGHEQLADRVEHVSVSEGDGLGFDIRSFETTGSDRLIEVKTTAGGKQTPFFVSRNEVNVSRARENVYHIYRVFEFRKDPHVFSVCGALDKVCSLEPITFSARIA